MSRTGSCPRCGLPLPNDAPRGLCPECLFRGAFPGDSVLTEEEGADAERPARIPVAPTVSQLSNDAPAEGKTAHTALSALPGDDPESSLAFARPFAGSRPGDPPLPNVDGYDISSVIGLGGMGVVYHATQQGTKRAVALKMIRRDKAVGPEQLQRFRIEGEAIARLQHPNVVQIYEVGEVNGQPFFSLEFLQGKSLADRLAEGPMRSGAAAALAAVLARAVHAAHSVGIVHRDLKPANVLFDETGRPKVADFGLAKRLDVPDSETETGQVMGTPSYMAPEQARGEIDRIGPATDVFALGSLLYEMLTGRPPFKGPTILETLRQVNEDDAVPPSRLQRSVSRDLETICLKCLQKEPKDRYSSAEALADDLDRFLGGVPVRARRTPAPVVLLKWIRRHPSQAALVATLSAILLGVAIASERARIRTRLDETNLANLRLETIDGLDQARRLRVDGQWNPALEAFSRLEAKSRGVRRLEDLHDRAQTELAEVRQAIQKNEDHSRTQARFAEFQALRNEAMFLDGSAAFLPGNILRAAEEPDDGSRPAPLPANEIVERTRRTARAALAVFGRDGQTRTPLPDALSPLQREEVEAGCSLILIVLSEAVATPLAGEDPRTAASEALRVLDRVAEYRSRTPALHLRRADCLERLGDTVTARRERAEAARLEPSDDFDHLLLGLEAYRCGEWDRARGRFDSALNLRPDSFWAACLLAVAELNSTPPRAAEAKTHLTACLSQHRDFAWLYLLRGSAFGQLGVALSAAARTRSDPASLAGEAQGRFRSAEADFDRAQALGLDPSLQYVLAMNRGVLRFQRGDWKAAAADFERAVALGPKQAHAHASLAQALRKLDRHDDAIVQWDQAVALEPQTPAFRRGRAAARIDRDPLPPDQAELSLHDLEEASRLAPSGARGAADDHARRSRLLLRLGRNREALDAAEAALAIAPNSTPAHLVQVSALLDLERFDAAIRACDAAIAAAPGTADLYRLRGLARTGRGNPAGAIDDYTRALELATDDRGVVLRNRGWAYLFTHSFELALRDFDAVIRLEPSSAEGHAGRGAALVRLGRVREALADTDESLRTEPTARLYYLAAQTYTLASRLAAAEAGRRGRPASRDSLAYESRAAALLRRALDQTPAAERSVFWRTVVARDSALESIRRNPRIVEILKPADTPAARGGDRP